jgi:chromosome segregation ATPase
MKKRMLFCLFVLLGGNAMAVHTNEDGVVFTKGDGYALISGVVLSGAAYGLLAVKNFDSLNSSAKKLAVSAGVGVASGLAISVILSHLTKGFRDDRVNYLVAEKIYKVSLDSDLLKKPNLIAFILAHYQKNPFTNALRDFVALQEGLQDATERLSTILERGKNNRNTNKALYEKCEVLRKNIDDLYVLMLEKKTVVKQEKMRREESRRFEKEKRYEELRQQEVAEKRENDYKKEINYHIVGLQQRIEKLFSSKELESVKESQEQTIAYGISVVSQELFPLVGIVRKLRETVLEVKKIRETVIDREKVCKQKAKYESRYKELAVALREMRAKLDKEFPFELYEKRIQNIVSSEKYLEQAKIAEKRERQKRVIEELRKIEGSLKKSVEKSIEQVESVALEVGKKINNVGIEIDNVKSKLVTTNDGIDELKRDVSFTKNRVLDVKRKVDDMKRDISDTKDSARDAKDEARKAGTKVEDLKSNMRQISRDVITIRDNTRRN